MKNYNKRELEDLEEELIDHPRKRKKTQKIKDDELYRSTPRRLRKKRVRKTPKITRHSERTKNEDIEDRD